MPEWPPKSRAEYTTTPPLPEWQRLLDIGLHPFMDKFATGVLTHKYHWNNRQVNGMPPHAHKIQGDSEAKAVHPVIDPVIGHLGGWKEGVILSPKEEIETWHYGIMFPENPNLLQECVIDLHGPAVALIGRGSFFAFGLDLRGNTLPMNVSDRINRYDRSIPWPQI